MIFCVLAFIAIYTAVLGVATITLDIQWQIPISDITAPIWGIFMLGGLLASICVLGYIRMMGERSGKEDPDVVYRTTRITVVGEELFNDSGIKTVYCEAQSIPDGWHKDWTEWYRGDVILGYNGND